MARLAPSTNQTYSRTFIAEILENAPYIIKYEKWFDAEKDKTRWYMPHSTRSSTFIEITKERVDISSGAQEWVPNWRYLKFGCDDHPGPWFTCWVLERETQPRIEVPAVQRHMEFHEIFDKR